MTNNRRRTIGASLFVTVAVSGLLMAASANGAVRVLHRVTVPAGYGVLTSATGSEGSLWLFVMERKRLYHDAVFRVSRGGRLSGPFRLPKDPAADRMLSRSPSLVVDRAGNAWASHGFGQISRIAADGRVRSFRVPKGTSRGVDVGQLRLGPDGALWFVASRRVSRTVDDDVVFFGRISASGALSTTDLESAPAADPPRPNPATPTALWLKGATPKSVARVLADGSVATYPIPLGVDVRPIEAPDGFVTLTYLNHLIRLNPDTGATQTWKIRHEIYEITDGPEDAVWFMTSMGSTLYRVGIDGRLVSYPLPAQYWFEPSSQLTAGGANDLWAVIHRRGRLHGELAHISATGRISQSRVPGIDDIGALQTLGRAAPLNRQLWVMGTAGKAPLFEDYAVLVSPTNG